MAIEIPPETLARFDARQRAIIDTVNEWGYFEVGVAREHHVYRGRNILDVGMGGGPHSVAFIVGGAASYTGVDPLVGTDRVSDFRALSDLSRAPYAPFPYTPDEIMAAFPNVRLHSGYMEEVAPRLQTSGIDFITLTSVTEHLEHPDQVIKAAWEAGADGAVIWIAHANYYSWAGHHLHPREIAVWDRNDPEQTANVDWAHLAPEHPAYSMPHLNRMRLDDFRALVETYFEIIQWREYFEYPERLTPEIRWRWKKYTISELLARTAFVYARKRAVPLARDLSQFAFFHPDEAYRADEDHSRDSDEHIRQSNLVFFARTRMIGSHSYNNCAGGRLLGRAEPGGRLTVRKYDSTITLTVETVGSNATGSYVQFVEDVAPQLYDENSQDWEIIEIASPPTYQEVAPHPLPEPAVVAAGGWLRQLAARAARLVR